MDIYNFINSKDIEIHCRNNQYNFTPLECAFLIWQCRKYTISEKHKAYQKLIDKFPDYLFYLREWDYMKISLQQFLIKYMEIENRLINILENNKIAAVTYIKSSDNIDSLYPFNEKLYLSKHICLSAINKYENKSNRDKCKVIFRPLLLEAKERTSSISLYVNEELEDVFITETGFLSAEEIKIFHTFDEIRIEISLPFKDNDLLIEKYIYNAEPFEYKTDEFEFSDTGMGLISWIYPFEEEIYVSNYLNLEYAPQVPKTKYDTTLENMPFWQSEQLWTTWPE